MSDDNYLYLRFPLMPRARDACRGLSADEILQLVQYMLVIGHYRREAAWNSKSAAPAGAQGPTSAESPVAERRGT